MHKKYKVKKTFTLLIVSLVFSFIGVANNISSAITENDGLALASTSNSNETYSTYYFDYSIPNLTLYNHKSQAVSLRELLVVDSPVVLNFIFTSCPTICSVLTSTFAKLQSKLKVEEPEVQIISVSIDPEHDTPAVLHDYAVRFKAKENWTFLTGKSSDIESLQKSFNTFRGDKMSHIPVFFMRTVSTQKWLRVEGFPSIEDIINEYRDLSSI